MKRLLAVVVTSALMLSAGAAFAQGTGPRHDPRAVQTAAGNHQSWGSGYDRDMMYEAYGWDDAYGWGGSYGWDGPHAWDGPYEWNGPRASDDSYGSDAPYGWDCSNYGWGCGGW